MEQKPKIGVIIPVYNCEKYISAAIESVLNQPYAGIDIVLVNDGSGDSSPVICDHYAAQYARVHVLHQKNAGVSAARNAGIEYLLSVSSDTDYVAFLDADDKWAEGFLTEDSLAPFQKQYDLVGFQTARCNHSTSSYHPPISMDEGVCNGGAAAVWKNSKQTFGSAFYALKIIDQYHLRFPDGLKINEDIIFSMQFKYLASTIYLENKLLYLYRNNQSSASHKRTDAVSKYVPIIDAYMKSDRMMLQYQNEQRGVLCEGKAMAAVYTVDVCEEHYQNFGSRRNLDAMFKEKPEYLELITGPFACNRPDSGLRWREMLDHPVKFRLRCYVKGIATTTMRFFYVLLNKIPAIEKLMDKMRYPISM